jgi:hypothetical protein
MHMTKPTPRPPRKPPAYPSLVACVIGATNLVGCKSSPTETPAGEMQPSYGLSGATTTRSATPSPTHSASGPCRTSGPTVPPEMNGSATTDGVPPNTKSELPLPPQENVAGGLAVARSPTPPKAPSAASSTATPPRPPVIRNAGARNPTHRSPTFDD